MGDLAFPDGNHVIDCCRHVRGLWSLVVEVAEGVFQELHPATPSVAISLSTVGA